MIDSIINWLKMSDVHIPVGIFLFGLGIFSLKLIPRAIIHYCWDNKKADWDYQPTIYKMSISNTQARGQVPPP